MYRLIPTETEGLLERDVKLQNLDQDLAEMLTKIQICRSEFEDATQEFLHIQASKDALKRFEDAGIGDLIDSQADQGRLEVIQEAASGFSEIISTLKSRVDQISIKDIKGLELKKTLNGEDGEPSYQDLFQKYKEAIEEIEAACKDIEVRLAIAIGVSESHVNSVLENVQKNVVEKGGKAEDVNQFDALTASVADLEKVVTKRNKARSDYYESLRRFARTRHERKEVVKQQREAMKRVAEMVGARFPDHIRIKIQEDGLSESLENWLYSLRESGITRWWNSHKEDIGNLISPEMLHSFYKMNMLDVIGMSKPVAATFRGLMSFENKLRLASLRNEDKYFIQLKIGAGDDTYGDIDELSGGAQVSVLLSLIFETDDTAPLVVDQPEDELDKAYLFDVLLPALRRLKGRRQVIISTHDANIVVNGDADNVIYLEADYDHGRVSARGAIEEQDVKSAILKTLDGGQEAFALRQAKYGF